MDEQSSDVDRTARWMCSARRILAYGGLDGVVRRPLFHDRGLFPQFVHAAEGCRVTDSTGQVFVDWINGWGPNLLGYRHPRVERAIQDQLRAGPTLSFMHPVEVEVAEVLTEIVPCAEMVAFGKNGSDALTAATRIARAVTGREEILQFGMHGFHDWYVPRLAGVRGVPACLDALVASFPFNDLAALERAFNERPRRVAAVVMEPSREQEPQPGYLAAVRELCHRAGALLVFDEVVTALRLGPGGAQALYGVVPDLACLGKSLANGMPLSAVVGRRELMQVLPSTGFGLTFRGETFSLAAARAVLDVVRSEPVAEHLASVGREVRAHFDSTCRRLELDWRLEGHPSRQTLLFAGSNGWHAEELRDLFVQECLVNGILTNGTFLPSYAHDAAALESTCRALDAALEACAKARAAGPPTTREPGHGPVPRVQTAQGYAERLSTDGDAMTIEGWLLLPEGAADELVGVTPAGARITAAVCPRPDLAQAFPQVARAAAAGFSLRVPDARAGPHERHELDLLALLDGREAFRCRVVQEPGQIARATDVPAPPFWLGDGAVVL